MNFLANSASILSPFRFEILQLVEHRSRGLVLRVGVVDHAPVDPPSHRGQGPT